MFFQFCLAVQVGLGVGSWTSKRGSISGDVKNVE